MNIMSHNVRTYDRVGDGCGGGVLQCGSEEVTCDLAVL